MILLQYWLGAGNCDPGRVLAEALSVSATGLVIHSVGASKPSLDWIKRAGLPLAVSGLSTWIAIGSRGPAKWDTALANPAINALKAGFNVVYDAESAWSGDEGKPAARRLVDKVLAAVPDAIQRSADQAWWAPLHLPGGGATHPRFPTREFGEVVCARYVQAYAAVDKATGMQRDGASLRMLAWARAPSQYPACGTPATQVFATCRGYARSTQDACITALAEPHQIIYLGSRKDRPNELTPDVRRGLQAAAKIRAAGHATVAAFQEAAGLVADGVVGPRTLAALGVT